MSRTAAKKAPPRERRLKERSKASKKKAKPTRESIDFDKSYPTAEACSHCEKNLKQEPRALVVEEEVGRVFCSEECITAYFSPEIEKLEKEFFEKLSEKDLTPEEREKFAHLRWITLEEPDEVWCQKTLHGDTRYTLISEFKPASKKVWCVCVCLFLRGEPSFLYLAFPTKNEAMMKHYRRGDRVQWEKIKQETGDSHRQVTQEQRDSSKPSKHSHSEHSGGSTQVMDGLADAWTPDETLRAQLLETRKSNDIPPTEFELYQSCFDETLETPDEVWSFKVEGEDSPKMYNFIKSYPNEGSGVWYIILAKEAEEEEQIEILDAFPTRDIELVDRFRRGEQEVGNHEPASTTRTVH